MQMLKPTTVNKPRGVNWVLYPFDDGVAPTTSRDLEPRVIAMGTCRMLRIRKIGTTYLCENNQPTRDESGAFHEHWVAVAKTFADNAAQEALRWLWQSNIEVIKISIADHLRAKLAAKGRGE